ncbi:MAG: hypothetical protein AB8G86_11875 [Saprospiraceae bacterium]
MKFQLNSKISDIIITLYLMAMLFFRFQIEDAFRGQYLVSSFFGLLTLLLIWFLVKKKVLNPTYFGLLKEKAPNRQQQRNAKRQLQ